MKLGADVIRDLPREAFGKMLLGIGFLGGHRVPPLAVAVKGASAAIGDDVVGLEAGRLVLEGPLFLQRSPQSFAGIENGFGFVCHDNEVILIVALHG